jgi:uncharacterized protein YndB with AHSA1/START domain
MSALVECHSGIEYAERPTALWWSGERLEVVAVEAEWRTPEGKRFRVRTRDGQVFVLVYLELRDEWRVDSP